MSTQSIQRYDERIHANGFYVTGRPELTCLTKLAPPPQETSHTVRYVDIDQAERDKR